VTCTPLPSTKRSFFLFDSITLLSSGQTVYTGPVANVLAHFDGLGLPCPDHVNPADHLIDISTVDTRTAEMEQQSAARVNSLLVAWKHSLIGISSGNHPVPSTIPVVTVKEPGVSIFRQIYYLFTRNFWITVRDPFGLGVFLLEAIIIGAFVGWIFFQIPSTLSGIRSLQGFMYVCVGMQGYLLLLFTTWKVSVDMRVPLRRYALTIRFTTVRDRIKCTPLSHMS
jgi:ABC-2 type transporter